MHRRRIRLRAALLAGGLVAATVGLGGARAAAQQTCPLDPNLVITCSVVYGSDLGSNLTMDAYAPPGDTQPLPAVILIHGGGWTAGNNRGGMVRIAEAMASKGLVVFSINYTLATPTRKAFPYAYQDAQQAVAYVRTHPNVVNEWDIDPARVGAAGSSAGANLAALLGTSGDPYQTGPPVVATVSWSGPMDLTAVGCVQPGSCVPNAIGPDLAEYLGCYLPACPDIYRDASPINWVSGSTAPAQLWNSDNEFIPISQSISMSQTLTSACVGHELSLLPGNQHATYTDIVTADSINFLLQQLSPSPPALGCGTSSPLTGTAAALDPTGQVGVAFGGCCAVDGSLLATTWTYDGTQWVLQHPATSPPARLAASLAWDPVTATAVLFGGEAAASGSRVNQPSPYNAALKDTWTWDGTTWTKQRPVASPPARSAASMAYDAVSAKVVLFGGDGNPTDINNAGALGDTWQWNGTTWKDVTPGMLNGPVPRYGASLVTDPTGRPLLAGGDATPPSCVGTCLDLLNDTWEWNGSAWVQQASPQQLVARDFAAAAQAPGGGVLLFGGLSSSTSGPKGSHTHTEQLLSDTWMWDSGSWTMQTPVTSPPGRFGALMFEGPIPGQADVLRGGFTGAAVFDGATWTWDGSAWAQH